MVVSVVVNDWVVFVDGVAVNGSVVVVDNFVIAHSVMVAFVDSVWF